jgi:D-beta-D-heptose 7-phosphate kinase / D-beta-D-heptose 1-phosphate adenosyltransferase
MGIERLLVTVALAEAIDGFAGRRIVVIGEAMLDAYLEGQTDRFCQEAPVPIVTLSNRRDAPGGAANTAANLRSLGAEVELLSAVGTDLEGRSLMQALEKEGVPSDRLVVSPARRTLARHRIIASSQMLLRLDQGTTEQVDPDTEQALVNHLADCYSRCDGVIVSDYRYGVLTPRLIALLAELQARWSRILVIDSRRLTVFRAAAPTAVKPNFSEVLEILGARPFDASRRRAEFVADNATALLDATGARIAAVTLDSEGAMVLERGRAPYHSVCHPLRRSFVAGAGDTFTAAMTLGLVSGASVEMAVGLSSAASAVAVGKEGTAICTAPELREYVSLETKYIPQFGRLAARLEFYRQQGLRIVFTNGCFDILHRGHITYLNRAKLLGDVLVVAVNSDDSIRRIKGPARPINTLEDRIGVLAALSCIDHLTAFDEDIPWNVIEAVRPHVFVKGGDYTRERLPEASLVEKLGGVVEILPLLQDRSTTGIIERIQKVQAPSE